MQGRRAHIVRRRNRRERLFPVQQVAAIGLAALILAALFDADALLEDARGKPYGTERDVSLAIWRPVHWVSEALALDEPREWVVQELRPRLYGESAFVRAPGPPPEPAGPAAGAEADRTPAPSAEPTPAARPPRLRRPTAEEPLRLWVGGDSMAQVFGESLVRLASETRLIDPTLDYRISSGLTRPDYFDWPSYLRSVLEQERPEGLVLVFGANDAQGIVTPEGEIFQPFEDGWVEEYRRRVREVMDLVEGPERLVVWVGQPIAASEEYSRRMARLNAIYAEEAAGRPGVVFVDSWSLFVDDGGRYSAYLPDEDGDIVLMRQEDGIHLTRAGGDRLAKAVLEVIAQYVPLEP